MRKTGLFIVGLLVGVSAGLGATTLVTQMASAKAAGADTYRQLALFGDVFERVRSVYVTEPNEEELVENAINGMLSSLAPHSSYLNPKDISDMRVQTRGEFGGLGIEVTMENELVKVISPIEGTPASEAGVLAGDLIYQIDGEAIRGLTLQEAVDKMRGPVNTPIELKIQREGADAPITITVIRDIIKVRSVRWRVERDTIGYIDINSFTEQTDSGLEEAIEKIKEQIGADKVTGYVIDLRLNPGGLLDQAVNVSDAFLDRGEIVSTRSRHAEDNDISRYQRPYRRPCRRQAGDRAGRMAVRPRASRRSLPALLQDHQVARPIIGSAFLRQGVGPDDHPARRQRRPAPDHRSLFHAFGHGRSRPRASNLTSGSCSRCRTS